MFKKIKRLVEERKQNEIAGKYLSVSENEINEELQRKIGELERIAEDSSKVLQRKYSSSFAKHGKQNLRIWICRDIDGDEIDDLTSEKCLEKEYRSQIAVDYDDPESEE
ncbi:hypothetical protein [Peribacillus frigoritolerans]|uniref:hypothetical protein n=1 Tax=Peribacillus frigoritolerans TaxID=450367 RepID=UPI00257064D5|nr:hypothetical protein [Peribacillus frigoritolerans]